MAEILEFPGNKKTMVIDPEIVQLASNLQFIYEHLLDETRNDSELKDLALSFSYQMYGGEVTDSFHRQIADEVVKLYQPIAA